MADRIELEIVTPERRVVAERVDEVVLPSEDGYMGVRPGHAPLLARLQIGEISYRIGGEERILAVSGGYAEVLRDSVAVLAETAEPAAEIDLDRAERARRRAEEKLRAEASESEHRRAEVALKRAINRISAHGRGSGV